MALSDKAIENLYKRQQQTISGLPPGMEDPLVFYTPEMQQAVLENFSRQSDEQTANDQAAISGGAVASGFGIGGSSREAVRRAKADAAGLDRIINFTVQQAADVETMRTQQEQEQKQREFQASEAGKDQALKYDLAKEGYQGGLDSASHSISDQNQTQRQDYLFGGLSDLAEGGGYLFGARNQQPNSLPPSLSLFGPGQAYNYANPGQKPLFQIPPGPNSVIRQGSN